MPGVWGPNVEKNQLESIQKIGSKIRFFRTFPPNRQPGRLDRLMLKFEFLILCEVRSTQRVMRLLYLVCLYLYCEFVARVECTLNRQSVETPYANNYAYAIT